MTHAPTVPRLSMIGSVDRGKYDDRSFYVLFSGACAMLLLRFPP